MREYYPECEVINACDMPVSIMGLYAQALGLPPNWLEARYFDLNHFSFFCPVLLGRYVLAKTVG